QPAYIDCNAYFNGAKNFDRENKCFVTDENPNVKIETENGQVFLEIDFPEDFIESDFARMDVLDCDKLPVPRLSEQRFDSPDGSKIVLDKDMLGESREDSAVLGPIQNLKAGHNRIRVW
ncbi:MAG: hypothetical protein II716_12190, partial [Treponema sp.]|nr:hypothetical protein [Treponema sp.]